MASEVNGDHIEALVLQTASLEMMLRLLITTFVGKRKKTHKKYWDGDAKFSQLISFYELLGGKPSIVAELVTYNARRNKIIHNTLHYESIEALMKEAQATYKDGVALSKKILRLLGFKIPPKFNKPLPYVRPLISTKELNKFSKELIRLFDSLKK